MLTDEVSIYNLALNAVGTRSNIALPDEKSREAEVCRLWFGLVRDRVLRAAPWGSAKAFSRLSLLREREEELWNSLDPEPSFRFAYGVPSNLLNPRYLSGYQRFTYSRFGDKMAIMTDQPMALLTYTSNDAPIRLWDVSLQMAIVHALAAHIAMPLHGKIARARNALEQANDLILQAREETGNVDMARVEAIPPWIAARGYGTPLVETRYFYPNGELFSAGELGV